MAAIEVRDLFKNYKTTPALQGVSLSVEQGEIYGFLGQNGAGKTTLVKILLSLVRASGGTASLLGREVPNVASRERVGYLPEDHRFPDYHTAASLLDFLGALSGMPLADRRRRIPEALDQVALLPHRDQKIRTFSKGMRQRLGIAQAVLHDPEVVFLDEPTDGVDPIGRKNIRQQILDLKSRGKTVFINSHLLGEVEMICDRVAILSKGRLLREGRVVDLTRSVNAWEIRVEGRIPDETMGEIRKAFPEVKAVRGGLDAELPDAASLNRLIDFLRARGLLIVHVASATLEDVFMRVVQE